ncbi:MFS transporter [Acidovorax sp. JHL-9]|uniref:MFS transporter n=1 Tax=Acidovorax sp. JHL-9 TaxID=1276756 RepID=UPI0004243CB1|nr:MFS transporter [Acidovorax sp. JHL-9]
MNTAALNAASTDFERLTYAKVALRIIPFMFFCYVLAYLDRVNVSFAKLQMLNDLQLSEAVYGLGAGIFFIGYFLFEVPSNLFLHRFGARRWIARIMITWGLVSAAMMFVTTPTMFYVLRFLLGIAEAGFFPGIILYLTYWFPSDRRGRMTAMFMTAIPISGVLGSPLSGWIMETFAGLNGWAGWQWLFLLEGVPTALVGLVVLFYLDDDIAKAKWLTADEKSLLSANIAKDQQSASSHSFRGALGDIRVWVLSAVYFGVVMGLYGIGFWLPSLIKATGVQHATHIGLLTAIPYAAATVCMIFVSRSADRYRERRIHFAIPCLLGAVGLVLSTIYADNTTLALVALSVACAGIMGGLPVFWSCPTAFLGGAAAAGGIALINSLGNLAGFVSPYMVGFVKDMTQSTASGMYVLAACLVLSAILIMAFVPARTVNR